MPDELYVKVFHFQGKAELTASPNKPPASIETLTLTTLSELEDSSVASQIEYELQKLLPPLTNVQADIHFSRGSILFAGSVAIISWLGTTVLNTATEEIQTQLTEVIKMGIRRVLSRVLPPATLDLSLSPVTTPKPAATAPTTLAVAQPNPASGADRYQWILIGLVALAILQVLFWVDGRAAPATSRESPQIIIVPAGSTSVVVP